MIAAYRPVHRSLQAKLLVADSHGEITHAPSATFVDFLRPGDLVIANDTATLPASLRGKYVPTVGAVEGLLAGRHSLAPDDVYQFSAILFGSGDYRTRLEDRTPPPVKLGDQLILGPFRRQLRACSITHDSYHFTSTGRSTGFGQAWRDTADRSSIHTWPIRSQSGTCGRRSPARRSRLSRRRPASPWIGWPSR